MNENHKNLPHPMPEVGQLWRWRMSWGIGAANQYVPSGAWFTRERALDKDDIVLITKLDCNDFPNMMVDLLIGERVLKDFDIGYHNWHIWLERVE